MNAQALIAEMTFGKCGSMILSVGVYTCTV